MADSEMKYLDHELEFSLTTSERLTDAGRDEILSHLRLAHSLGAIDVDEYQKRLDFVMDSLTKRRAELALQDLPRQEIRERVVQPPAKQRRSPSTRKTLVRAAMIPIGVVPFLCVILTIGPDPASNGGQAADGLTATLAFWWIVIWSLLALHAHSERRRNR